MSDNLKSLPLESVHQSLKAKMVPFAGWKMPVQYSGIVPEHHAVRTAAGIFDVSHMGQMFVRGERAQAFLDFVSTNSLDKLEIGRAQYGLVLNSQGGVIDDIINYKISNENFFVCVNASNTESVFNWFRKQAEEHKFDSIEILNKSDKYVQIAVQGPLAMSLLSEHFGPKVADLKRFAFVQEEGLSCNDLPCLIARTGYSGEDGCEIFVPEERGAKVWEGLFYTANKIKIDLKPCGLGARDTLRLEACLPLHGHEIREDITPLSAKLAKFVNLNKDFIGGPALRQQLQMGVSPVLVGLKVEGPGIIRSDYQVIYNERTVGWVTSGTLTPTLNVALGLALVMPEHSEIGTILGVRVRDKVLPVVVVPTPFYKRAQ